MKNSENILEKIYKASLRFLNQLTPSETYAAIVEEAKKLVQAESGSMFLNTDNGFERVYATNPLLYKVKPRKKGHIYSVYTSGKPMVTEIKDLEVIHPQLKKMGTKSVIFIPLSYKNHSIGVLTVQAYENKRFTNKELEILNLFGSMASLAVKKNQSYEETKKALETRDLFISMAAHELRTPLTAVNGYIQLLKNKLLNKEGNEGRWIEQLYAESVRLTHLVNELLEINRIKSEELQYFLRECSVIDIINRAKSNFQFSYPERQLIVEEKIGTKKDILIGDYDKILQAITNLLDNAVKYSADNTPIELILKIVGGYFVIQVCDQGIGIRKEEQEKIFEGFHRGSGHNKEGLGLGLFLVKDIVTRLHGFIQVKSVVNKGTTVEIRLPRLKV